MDEQDRLSYIRDCKSRLGLNDSVLLKSSKRTTIDQQFHKDMPYIEFNGYYIKDDMGKTVIKQHEMQWSLMEYNKDTNLEKMMAIEKDRLEKKYQRALVSEEVRTNFVLDKLAERHPEKASEIQETKAEMIENLKQLIENSEVENIK